ncbi:hypothetical protein PROFUN_13360 [Planoprotostelium fungivorum]|uniref:Uncharacterized protein n=1 Tax=Planoprotostelium fungivorum TaxID=1890364 RepID=A0A2P6N459_9EUKA|nr:hypothetical protein PROFUN_13360 [Planoprotostelium fungivorum]
MSDTRLYIGRLSSRTRERDLDDEFGRYGRISRLDMKNGFAFIEFNDPRDADEAVRDMNGRSLDGHKIIVERAKGSEGRGPRREDEPPAGRCYNCGKSGHWARDCPDSDGRLVYTTMEWLHCVSTFGLASVYETDASTVELLDIWLATAAREEEEEALEVADTILTTEDPDLPADLDLLAGPDLPEEDPDLLPAVTEAALLPEEADHPRSRSPIRSPRRASPAPANKDASPQRRSPSPRRSVSPTKKNTPPPLED